MVTTRLGTSKPTGQTGTRAHDICDCIRLDILSLKLRPGSPLHEEELAAAYRVSRTPIREAIRKLERDGLVTVHPRRGAFISEISMRRALEIDQLRELLEPVAARRAAARISDEALAEISGALEQLKTVSPDLDDYVRYLEIDVRLHELILRAAGNETMCEVVTRLHHRMNAVRIVTTAPRYEESIAEHKRIIAALRARDGETAAREMATHITNAAQARVRAFSADNA